MKKNTLLFLLLFSVIIQAQVTSGLLHEFRFNNTYTNESGNVTFGNNANTNFQPDRFGNTNAAVYINETSIQATMTLPTGSAARSFSLWIKVQSTTTPVFSYGTDSYNSAYGFSVKPASLTNFGYGNDLVYAINPSLPNLWKHLVTTYDGTTAKMYLDGVEIGSALKNWNTWLRAPLKLGSDADGNVGRVMIDDLKIYNRAITPTEIVELFRQQNSGTRADAIVEYNFNNTYNDVNGTTPFNATANRTSFTQDRHGNPNSALYVDFATNPGTLAANLIAPTGKNPRTISIWYTASQNSGSPAVFSYGTNTAYKTFGMYLGSNGNPIFQGNNYDYDFTGTYARSAWHHAIVSFDGTTVTMYLDGENKGTVARPLLDTPHSTTAPFGTNFSLGIFGVMRYDDLKIIPRVISDAEAQALYLNNNLDPLPVGPQASAAQSFCPGATIDVLSATGSGLKWYQLEFGGTSLFSGTALVNGTTYYVSQNIGGLESSRTPVTVTINTIPVTPTATAGQVFCPGATYADIVTDGQNIRWYTSLLPQNGVELPSTTEISRFISTLYFTQSVNGCQSERGTVSYTYNQTNTIPLFTPVAAICSGATNPLPLTSTNGIAGTWSPAFDNTDTKTYTFNPVLGQCATTTTLAIVVNTVATPTGNASQTFVQGATIASLVISPSNVEWYASNANAITATNPLPNTTLLVNGSIYYAVNISAACRSTPYAITATAVTLGTDNYSKFDFSLYPNPTDNVLNIEMANKIKSVEIYNIRGQKVLLSNKKQINVSELKSGIYLIKIQDIENKIIAKKFVKQ